MNGTTVNPAERLEQQLAAIAAREGELQAFVPETFDEHRVRADFAAACERTPNGPLLGHLLGVKDIFHVDGYPTRAGTSCDPALFKGPQASTVSALITAGAVVAGKTTTAELACWVPPPTVNPHHPGHTPGGSSSGSAAGVGAGFFSVGFGSQTVGSVLRPAAYCGAVGWKPTRNRIASDGMVDYSPSIDHVGFITDSMATLTAVLDHVMVDWRPISPAAAARVAVPTGPYLDRLADGADAFADARGRLAAAGVDVVEVATLPDIVELEAELDRFTYAEAGDVHARRWAEIVAHCDPRYVADVERASAMPLDERDAVVAHTVAVARQLDAQLDAVGADLWLTPSAPGVATEGLDSTGDPAMNAVWTFAGLPAISIPFGTGRHDLPLGLQLVGRFGADEQVISQAAAFPL